MSADLVREYEEHVRKLNRKLAKIEAEHAEMAAALRWIRASDMATAQILRDKADAALARIRGEAP